MAQQRTDLIIFVLFCGGVIHQEAYRSEFAPRGQAQKEMRLDICCQAHQEARHAENEDAHSLTAAKHPKRKREEHGRAAWHIYYNDALL